MYDNISNVMGNLGSFDNYNNAGFGGDFFEEDRVCPMCKTHESDVKETNMVGCAHCYKVFRDTVSRIGYRLHGRLEHLGKVPVKRVSRAETEKQIAELKKLMHEAAAREDFEGAQNYKRKLDAILGEGK